MEGDWRVDFGGRGRDWGRERERVDSLRGGDEVGDAER